MTIFDRFVAWIYPKLLWKPHTFYKKGSIVLVAGGRFLICRRAGYSSHVQPEGTSILSIIDSGLKVMDGGILWQKLEIFKGK